MTPGQHRSHARFQRHMAEENRRLAAQENATAFWRRHWLNDAERREETADWHDERAGWGEITVEYSSIEFQEAAE